MSTEHTCQATAGDYTPAVARAARCVRCAELANRVPCQWFALCDHLTSQGLEHPVLGVLPICDRCLRVIGAEATHDIEVQA